MYLFEKKKMWLLIVFVILGIGLFFSMVHVVNKNNSIDNKIFQRSNFTIYYGEHKKNFVDIYYIGSSKTAIIVHGGGFIGGNARDEDTMMMVNYFLSLGYNVASVEYRTCENTKFRYVLKDIYKGIRHAISKIDNFQNQERYVLVGYSAGATAISILLLGDIHAKIDNLIKYYILLSGIYNVESINMEYAKPTLDECGKILLKFMNYTRTPSQDIRIMLVEGDHDQYDLYAGKHSSHMEYLKDVLKSKGINDVTSLWIKGRHGSTLRIFREEKYDKVLGEFLVNQS